MLFLIHVTQQTKQPARSNALDSRVQNLVTAAQKADLQKAKAILLAEKDNDKGKSKTKATKKEKSKGKKAKKTNKKAA